MIVKSFPCQSELLSFLCLSVTVYASSLLFIILFFILVFLIVIENASQYPFLPSSSVLQFLNFQVSIF